MESGVQRAWGRETDYAGAEDLVTGLQAGDPVAFERMVRLYGPRLLAVARRIMRDREDARDALQDAFVQVVQSVADFSARSLLSTWLHRVVVNACLMRLRARRRRPEVPLADVSAALGERARGGPAWDPVETILRKRRLRLVWRCIERLPESYRTVLLLRDIQEHDTRETAARLRTSRNAVKVRLHRAHRAVAELVRNHQTAMDGKPRRRNLMPKPKGRATASQPASKTKPRRKRRQPKAGSTISAGERDRMVAEAAYFKAERRRFSGGSCDDDWCQAAAEIDAMLAEAGMRPPGG